MRLVLIAVLALCFTAVAWAQNPRDTRGSPLYLGELYFGFDEIKPLKQRHDEVARIARAIKQFSEYYDWGIIVVLDGHTDSIGSNEYNLDLGENRAIAVWNLLAQQGIPDTVFRVLTHGENMPEADNRTAAGRAKNRRVEIYLVR